MKRFIPIITALTLLGLNTPVVAYAAPPPVIRESVGVCDYNAPTHCTAPNVDGSINTKGGAPKLTPLGYQQISSLSSATALTVPTGTTVAYIIPESQAVRCRDDGTNPTATVGQPVAVGAQLTYSASLTALKCIEQTASAKLNVWYYK